MKTALFCPSPAGVLTLNLVSPGPSLQVCWQPDAQHKLAFPVTAITLEWGHPLLPGTSGLRSLSADLSSLETWQNRPTLGRGQLGGQGFLCNSSHESCCFICLCTDETPTGSYRPQDTKPHSSVPGIAFATLARPQETAAGGFRDLLCSSPFLAQDTLAAEQMCVGHFSGLGRARDPEQSLRALQGWGVES